MDFHHRCTLLRNHHFLLLYQPLSQTYLKAWLYSNRILRKFLQCWVNHLQDSATWIQYEKWPLIHQTHWVERSFFIVSGSMSTYIYKYQMWFSRCAVSPASLHLFYICCFHTFLCWTIINESILFWDFKFLSNFLYMSAVRLCCIQIFQAFTSIDFSKSSIISLRDHPKIFVHFSQSLILLSTDSTILRAC